MRSHSARTVRIAVFVVAVLAVSSLTFAQIGVEVVHAFRSPSAVGPAASLVQATDGNFYGVTRRGGMSDAGTIYRMTADGSLTVIHEFSGPDGTAPGFALIQANDGNLYGTTANGGDFGRGVAFRITLDGVFSVLHSFTGNADGGLPSTSLVQAMDGNLYGGTTAGGASNNGIIYRMTLDGSVVSIHDFPAATLGGEGGAPTVLIAAADGNLYGAASGGVFRLTPAGSFVVLQSFFVFCGLDLCNDNGFGTNTRALVVAPDGLYGVNAGGGPRGHGAIFRIASTGTTVVHAFSDTDPAGEAPIGLTRGSDSNFYGVTCCGPFPNHGTAFRMDSTGGIVVLHAFNGTSEGNQPAGSLVLGSDGSLFGVMSEVPPDGGPYHAGTAFALTTAGDFSVVHTFLADTDGAAPNGVIQASDGNFYGTTGMGGAVNGGTLFRLAGNGSFALVHEFTDTQTSLTQPDGSTRAPTVMQALDGDFYGTTGSGGVNGNGSLFRVTSTSVYSDLFDFSIFVPALSPQAPLVQTSDGTFYGTSAFSTPICCSGDVFTWSAGSGFTQLHHFTDTPDGASPKAALLRASDGAFYSTTAVGGAAGLGTVFRMTTDGTLTIVHDFAGGADGAGPVAPLIQATDGNFYGTTFRGGAAGLGTVFRVTPAGTLTVLHAFTGADGANPSAALLQASDGNLYGVTEGGGAHGVGAVFKLTLSGTFSLLHSFTGSDGAQPTRALIQATNGSLYGTTERGGPLGGGIVFRLIDASCEDALTLTDTAGTLNLGFTLRTATGGLWSAWLVAQRQVHPLWSITISPTTPAKSFNIPIPAFPHLGPIGVLTTLTNAANGSLCGDWKVVDTGIP